MAGTLTFKVKEVRRLVEHSKASKEHSPSYEDLFNPEYHKGGKVIDNNGWPDSNNIDHSKIPAGLLLVKDQGVYLLSNGMPPLLVREGEKRQVVAYAKEANPTMCEDWWEAGREIMGGDDCAESLPLSMFETIMDSLHDDGEIKISVTETHIKLFPVAPAKKGRKA